jgi:Ni2+-binding GTPase involved in maturation of urease and hydrogenase
VNSQSLKKNSMPTCFIGLPGVGKTALVENVCGDLKLHLCVIPMCYYDASELKSIPRVLPLEELRKVYPEHVKENNSGFVTYYAHNL